MPPTHKHISRCGADGAETVRVSVIIVTYNHERYIGEAIESVLSQRTQFGFELIISEDCSTDATRRIIQEYADKTPDRIRLILSEKNLCTNMVTERAIRAARGEFVAFLDGDDYLISPDKLQRQVDFLDSHRDHTMCYHNARIIREGEEEIVALCVKPNSPQLSDLSSIFAANPVPGSTSMFRASALRSLPDWVDDAPFGDWPLYVVAAQHGLIGYIDEPLSVYRHHPNSFWSSLPRWAQYDALIDWYDYLIRHMPTGFSAQLKAAREVQRTRPSFVAHAGQEFLALYESGKRLRDGYCTQSLKLQVRVLSPANGVRIVMANPKFDAGFAGNRIEVSVNDMAQARSDLAPGETFELDYPLAFATGESFSFEAKSSLAFGRNGKASPLLGFCLLGLTQNTNPGCQSASELF